MTPEDLRLMACSVLLATLSILPYDRQERHQDENQVEQEKERIMHMANILGFAVVSWGMCGGKVWGKRGHGLMWVWAQVGGLMCGARGTSLPATMLCVGHTALATQTPPHTFHLPGFQEGLPHYAVPCFPAVTHHQRPHPWRRPLTLSPHIHPLCSQDSKKDYRTVLSRAALLSHTTSAHILGSVPADVRQLYDMLTAEFNPLELCQRLTPLFAKLAEFPSTMSAASPVKEVVLTRYVDNLKQVCIWAVGAAGASAGGWRARGGRGNEGYWYGR